MSSIEHDPVKRILLLTATITPAKMQVDLAVRSSEDRLKEYTAALDFYWRRRNEFDILVFAENSGYDLTQLQGRYPSESFLFIPVSGNVGVGEHRGVGELRIIHGAVSVIEDLGLGDYFVLKVSGRYRLMNVGRIFDSINPDSLLTGRLTPGWLELSAISWNRLGGAWLMDFWGRCPPSMAPEIHLAQEFSAAKAVEVSPWCVAPFLRGRLGASGKEIEGRFWFLKYLLFCLRQKRF